MSKVRRSYGVAMKLNRIFAAMSLGVALMVAPVRAEEPIKVEKKELLKDEHADHDAPKPEAKVVPVKRADAKITPEAKDELERVTSAYRKVKSLAVTGSASADFAIGGEVMK